MEAGVTEGLGEGLGSGAVRIGVVLGMGKLLGLAGEGEMVDELGRGLGFGATGAVNPMVCKLHSCGRI